MRPAKPLSPLAGREAAGPEKPRGMLVSYEGLAQIDSPKAMTGAHEALFDRLLGQVTARLAPLCNQGDLV